MTKIIDANLKFAQKRWGRLSSLSRELLQELCSKHGLSVPHGDLLYLDNHWYITHGGLLRIALREGCLGIRVSPVEWFCKAEMNTWAFEATVYRDDTCKGFSGFGDANPANVSPFVRGAELRIAETRAVNRALRKAYGIGLCSIEEIGSNSGPSGPPAQQQKQTSARRSSRRQRQWPSSPRSPPRSDPPTET